MSELRDVLINFLLAENDIFLSQKQKDDIINIIESKSSCQNLKILGMTTYVLSNSSTESEKNIMLIRLQTLVNKLCINSTNKDDKRAITGDTLLALTAYLKRTAKRKPILIEIHARPRLRSIKLDSNSPEWEFTLNDESRLLKQPEKTAIELDEIKAYQELIAGTLTEKAHNLSIFSNPIPTAIEVKWKKLMPFAKDTQAILDAPYQYTTINIDRQLSLEGAKSQGKEVLKTLIHQITHADISYEIIHQCFWLIDGVPDDKWCAYYLTNDIPWDIKIEFSLWFLKQLERGQVDLWDKEVSKYIKNHLVTFLIKAMGDFQGISNIPLNLELSAVLKELMTLTDDDLVNDAFSKLESLYQKQLLLIKSDSSIDSSLISLIDLQHTLLDSTINTKDADDVLDQLDSLTLDESKKILCILKKISMLTLNQDQKERLNNYVRSQLSPLEFILDPHNIDYYECGLLFLYSRITCFIMPLMDLNSIALLKRITVLAFEKIEQLDIWLPNPHYLTEFLPLNTTQQKVLASKIYDWNDSNKDDSYYKYHELDHLYLLESNLVNAILDKKTRDQIIEQLHQYFRNKSYALSSISKEINENNHFMINFYNKIFSHFFKSNISSIEYFIKSLLKKKKTTACYPMKTNDWLMIIIVSTTHTYVIYFKILVMRLISLAS